MRADNTTKTVTSLAVEIIARHESLPEDVKTPFLRSVGRAKSTEQMLWREVAARMVLDAFGITPETTTVYDGMEYYRYKRYEKTVNNARAWFRNSGADVEQVFEMAVVDLGPILGALNELRPLTPPPSCSNVSTGRRKRTFGYIGKVAAA